MPSDRLRIFFASASVHITDHLPFGEGLIAAHLLTELGRRGHRVVACTDRVDLAEEPPFEVIRFPDARRWESLGPFARPYAVRRAFERRGGTDAFDAVHFLFGDRSEVALPPAPRSTTVIGPLPREWAVTDRLTGWRPGDAVHFALTPALKRRYRRELQDADVILASLDEVAQELPLDVQRRTTVLGFGIDTSAYSVTPMPALPRIVFVGKLIDNKRIMHLYDAFRAVQRIHPEAELEVVGEGPLEKPLRQRVAADGLASKVILRGPVSHPEIPQVLQRASVLCLPSVGEPFGMAILEAMSCGRPIVAVGLAGPKHLVHEGRGGRLVEPDDVSGLAAALAELVGNRSALVEMGLYNRARVEREFSLAQVVDRLEHLYAGGGES